MNKGAFSESTTDQTSVRSAAKAASNLPQVYDYVDFKVYLKDFYEYKKEHARGFSYSQFARKARLNSPNYLKRVIDGERPLSPDLIPKFCIGLGLDADAANFFEALVNFNQCKEEESKTHYFNILRQLSQTAEGTALEVMANEVDMLKNWYVFAIRELVLLKDFKETPTYIVKKLKNKITKAEAQHSLKTLIDSGLLIRDPETKRLKQSHDIVRYSQEVVNIAAREFHNQMLDRTKEAINEDDFGTWNLRALTIAIQSGQFQEIYERISNFVYETNKIYSFDKADVDLDLVVQMNCQLLQLSSSESPPKYKKLNNTKSRETSK